MLSHHVMSNTVMHSFELHVIATRGQS